MFGGRLLDIDDSGDGNNIHNEGDAETELRNILNLISNVVKSFFILIIVVLLVNIQNVSKIENRLAQKSRVG